MLQIILCLFKVRPYTLRLAAADASGVVTVWNVASGDIKAELAQPGHRTIIGRGNRLIAGKLKNQSLILCDSRS